MVNPANEEDLFCVNFVKRMLFEWVTEVELGDVLGKVDGGGRWMVDGEVSGPNSKV